MTRQLALTFYVGARLLLVSPRDEATRAWLEVVAERGRSPGLDAYGVRFALTDRAMREAAGILEAELRQSFPEEDIRVRAFAHRATVYELVAL